MGMGRRKLRGKLRRQLKWEDVSRKISIQIQVWGYENRANQIWNNWWNLVYNQVKAWVRNATFIRIHNKAVEDIEDQTKNQLKNYFKR